MANSLTGDYEAVLQIGVRQLNAILATMHQNRIVKDTSPSFPHNGTLRLDIPDAATMEATRFGAWASDAVEGLRAVVGTSGGLRGLLTDQAPPGSASLFQHAWHQLDFGAGNALPPGAVAGSAVFQLSPPSISVPAGAVSTVTVHAWLRARFLPDPGASSLAEPIHGEVQAEYVAIPIVAPDGRTVLRVAVTADDRLIQFVPAPGTGLRAADVQDITNRVRNALRRHFAPVDVELPGDFAFSEFKALGAGPTEALVLPLQLSGAPAPAGALAGVTNHLLGTSEFALAASREYVQRFLDDLTHSIGARASALRISLSGPLGTAHYVVSLSTISATWRPGAIQIAGTVNLTTGTWWAPNGFISFQQDITLVLDPVSQGVSVQAIGDPAVNESWWMSHGSAVNAVRNMRDSALPAASASLTRVFGDARNKFVTALSSFDRSASARYTTLEVLGDGIIVRGDVQTAGRRDPVVQFVEIDGGSAFDAVLSWIPGGRIATYDWTWVETTQALAWRNRTKHVFDDHRFVCLRPAEVTDASAICLRILGSRVASDGSVEAVDAGETCANSSHEPLLVQPGWWARLMLPLWQPDPPPDDFILSEQLAGHINVTGGSRRPGSVTTNTLVHFTGTEMDSPLERLTAAVQRATRQDLSLVAIVVLPAGALGQRRRELEARLGEAGEAFRGRLHVTEDYLGEWSRTFAAREGGGGASTHLVNALGQLAWQQTGRLDPVAAGRALDEHALAAPPPQRVAMTLTVRAGTPAPDAHFMDERGGEFSQRRLRGRAVRLVFWQSWCAPSMGELKRYQREQERDGPFVIAVNGGEGREVIAAVRRGAGFSFPLIHDPAQEIAEQYGVRCWPTTVSVNEDGIIDRIQFGVAHAHRDAAAAAR